MSFGREPFSLIAQLTLKQMADKIRAVFMAVNWFMDMTVWFEFGNRRKWGEAGRIVSFLRNDKFLLF